MKPNPSVSVIMTVYNGRAFVAESIDSILGQTFRDFEFVIVDDGSDDGTPDILASETDNRIVVVRQPRIGRARALNLAIRHSRGVYIANQDADDVAAPTRLEKQVAFLQEHNDVGVVGTRQQLVYGRGQSGDVVPLPLWDAEIRRALPRRNPFVHSSVMFPRSVLEEVGGYDEALSVSIDYELWLRIATQYRLANLPEVLTWQRYHGQAFFQNRISVWDRFRTRAALRWRAWRQCSRNPLDLWYVVDPIEMTQWTLRDKCPALRRVYHVLTGRRGWRTAKPRLTKT